MHRVPETILAATDFSDTADRAEALARSLAVRFEAALHLLHVIVLHEDTHLEGEHLVPQVHTLGEHLLAAAVEVDVADCGDANRDRLGRSLRSMRERRIRVAVRSHRSGRNGRRADEDDQNSERQPLHGGIMAHRAETVKPCPRPRPPTAVLRSAEAAMECRTAPGAAAIRPRGNSGWRPSSVVLSCHPA